MKRYRTNTIWCTFSLPLSPLLLACQVGPTVPIGHIAVAKSIVAWPYERRARDCHTLLTVS